MRLAIVNLTGGGMSGGYKKYLKTMLPRLSRHPEIEAILCASPQSLAVPSWFGSMDNVTFVNCKPFSILGNHDADLQNRLNQFHPDVIYLPIERYFKHRDVPTVCKLMNMLPMTRIRHASVCESIRNQLQKMITRKALERAQRIIAISGFVSDFLQKEWLIPSHKIGVVYYGVTLPSDEGLTIPAGVPLKWAGRFIFTAGSIELYRGLEDIIYALSKLKQCGMSEKVVIAGGARPSMKGYYRKLQELVNKLGLQDDVCWGGLLNDKEMTWCYRNAHVYVMSSRIEACPNTALEAMACGSVIISSNASPMPEFFGKAAIYYETGNAGQLADCLTEVFHFSSAQKDALSQKAVIRAREFSWDDTVNKTIIELQKAVACKVTGY